MKGLVAMEKKKVALMMRRRNGPNMREHLPDL
jgi:hypothetical protein